MTVFCVVRGPPPRTDSPPDGSSFAISPAQNDSAVPACPPPAVPALSCLPPSGQAFSSPRPVQTQSEQNEIFGQKHAVTVQNVCNI